MRLALALEYDGRDFCGFQSQPSGCGVQDALERALSEIAQRELKAVAAGRTDAGVPATSQVAHADVPDDRPLTAWVRGVNAHLPSSTTVLWAHPVPDDFHARFAATAPDVRRILGQLASALAYAHARRVVHLDIKPSNVMVNRDGIVKLMDFGVASPPSAAKEGTERTIVGTLPYMAPEQLAGEPCGVAADLYAVGGLAWEMLTGKRLFPGEDFVSLRNQHLAWSLPDIASALPGIAADLREFLLRSLAQDPDARSVYLREVASWAGRVNYGKLTGRAR